MLLAASLRRAYDEGGLPLIVSRIGRSVYRRLRPLLPQARHAIYGGVPISLRLRAGDLIVPRSWRDDNDDKPNYESALTAGLRAHVRTGDHVLVVGGGHGVTSVVAARLAGPTGAVTVYEASDEMVAKAKRTFELNGLADRINLVHGIVGESLGVWGDTTASLVRPESLPTCDVLTMDCEGAERLIIPALPFLPRVVLVETHGIFGASTPLVRSLLEKRGYSVVADEIAEADLASECEANDIHVLIALPEGDLAAGPDVAPLNAELL